MIVLLEGASTVPSGMSSAHRLLGSATWLASTPLPWAPPSPAAPAAAADDCDTIAGWLPAPRVSRGVIELAGGCCLLLEVPGTACGPAVAPGIDFGTPAAIMFSLGGPFAGASIFGLVAAAVTFAGRSAAAALSACQLVLLLLDLLPARPLPRPAAPFGRGALPLQASTSHALIIFLIRLPHVQRDPPMRSHAALPVVRSCHPLGCAVQVADCSQTGAPCTCSKRLMVLHALLRRSALRPQSTCA